MNLHLADSAGEVMLAALEPGEALRTAVGVVTTPHGVTEVHLSVGPVTFTLTDRTAITELMVAAALADEASTGLWRTCTGCGTTDALVTVTGLHSTCQYDAEAPAAAAGPPALRVIR